MWLLEPTTAGFVVASAALVVIKPLSLCCSNSKAKALESPGFVQAPVSYLRGSREEKRVAQKKCCARALFIVHGEKHDRI